MNDSEHCLYSVFLPSLSSVQMNATEQELLGLPLKYGDFGIINSVAVTNHCFDSSIHSTLFLLKSILGMTAFELDEYVVYEQSAKSLDTQVSTGYCTANVFEQFDVGPFSKQGLAILLGCFLCRWQSTSLIWLVKSFMMYLLCSIRSHC